MEVIFISILKSLMIQYAIYEDNRKRINTVLIIILTFLLIILITLASFPSILINLLFGDIDDPKLVDDMEKVAIYQDTILIVDQLNKKWIEEKKKEYSYCDDFEIIYNYDLTWYHLISIDSVKLSQDFRKMNQNEILENAFKFLSRTVVVEEREVEEDVGHNNSCSDDCDNIHIEIVRKKIAIITVETRKFEEVLPDVDIIDEEDVLMATNIFNNISSTGGIEGNLNIYDDNIDFGDLQEYSEGHANIPYYNQTDARWGYKSYGNSTIGHGGCGPTSLAMVISGLTGEKVTPDIVADWSYRNGHRAEGLGSYWSLMTAGGKYYGLNVQAVSRKDPKTIIKALSEGYPVIVSMGKGHFTNGGHFIVLRGITNDGKILVHDSASVSRSEKEWDLEIIMRESSTNGGINGSPFWIFKP